MKNKNAGAPSQGAHKPIQHNQNGVVLEDNKLSHKKPLLRAWLEGKNPDVNKYANKPRRVLKCEFERRRAV